MEREGGVKSVKRVELLNEDFEKSLLITMYTATDPVACLTNAKIIGKVFNHGCAHLLHTVQTNETYVAVSDPRVSTAIRALRPQGVYVVENIGIANPRVVIVRSGRPGVYAF